MRAFVFFAVLALVAAALLTPALVDLRNAMRVHFAHVSVFGHFALFSALGGSAVWAMPGRFFWSVMGGLLVLVVGFEAAQTLVPNRALEVDDVLANLTGAIVGAGLAHRSLCKR